jgi:hypothetical protein
MSKSVAYDRDGEAIDPNFEEVAQFLVSMRWGQEYYGSSPMSVGLSYVQIVIEGVATSTQAIEKAKEILKEVREDEPRETKAELKTTKRRIPKRVGTGSTIDA